MGAAPARGVRNALPTPLAVLTDKLFVNAAEIQQRATLTYEQFLDSLTTLSQIASRFSDTNGKQLVFLVKKGTDDSVLWRGTVRIKCHKVNNETNVIESTRLLNLKEYLRLYNDITLQAMKLDGGDEDWVCGEEGESGVSVGGASKGAAAACMDASMLLTGLDASVAAAGNDDEECVICMERPSQATLPCAHSFCEECIKRWQGSHRSCPICRAATGNSDDSWVLLSEKPDPNEIISETNDFVLSLINRYPSVPNDDSD